MIEGFRYNKISPRYSPILIFLLIIIIIMALSIIDTISSSSGSISQFAGPAIGGVIAVFAGYYFTKWDRNDEQERKKKFFANVFFLELKKINSFIDGIRFLDINKDNFLVTNFDTYGQPIYDTRKKLNLIEFLKDNPYYRITDGSQFMTKKNPFELFYSEIYSFGNENLINDLISVEKLLNDANSCLLDYFANPNASENYVTLFSFLANIEDIKKIISKILFEKYLENIAH